MPHVPALQHILAPVDFSDCSVAALRHATMLQRVSGARIHVLHAYNLPPFAPPYAMLLAGELDASLVEHAERFTKQHLSEFLAKHGIKTSDTLQASVEMGPAAATIIAVSQREKSDLIVLGTHGRTGWSRALMGSTTDKVLNGASCPVLTVKTSLSSSQH